MKPQATYRVDPDPLQDVPILSVIQPHVDLKQNGSAHVGLCPFHDEKTPSFTVFNKTNTFYCFGCGQGGDSIEFRMKHLGESFPVACRQIAKDNGISLDNSKDYAEYEAKQGEQETLYAVMEWAQRYFASELFSPAGKQALQYAKTRWDDETIKLWGLGYAPNTWGSLLESAKEKGYTAQTLLDAGLASEKNGKIFDYFRDRLLFPIRNKGGRTIAFTGREIIPNSVAPKYFNSPKTPIFDKGKALFGINLAHYQIRKHNELILTEGPTDVIKMHQAGAAHTVATMGVSLSASHVNYIQSISDHVTLIYDNDTAGHEATIKNGPKLISAGLSVFVFQLPKDTDPDNYFADKIWEEEISNRIDFLNWYAQSNATKTVTDKDEVVGFICNLLLCYPESSRELRLNDLSKIIKPKKVWYDKLKEAKKEQEAKINGAKNLPQSVNIDDFQQYGFYEDKEQLFFQTKNGIQRGANFTLAPLFHVESTRGEAKRLFVIKNQFGVERIIELAQRELISLSAFKLHIESLGNFIWELGEAELNRLKRFLYEKTKTCIEIKQLGWQKAGFFAWSNGIFDGKKFVEINSFGIIEHGGYNYYLPALSQIYKGDYSLFQSERLHVHKETNISLVDAFHKIQDVFGDSGVVGLSFFFATLFRDIIYRHADFFPILNLFGPKNTGKTALALTLIRFFGPNQKKGINIGTATKPSISQHVEKTRNCVCHFDEFKNDIDREKVEFLKSVHDGVGRTRMNMDKDGKLETTVVDCGVVFSGQEMPTADIALFSRVIYLDFSKDTFNHKEQQKFEKLEDFMQGGATSVVHEIIQHRDYFEKIYIESWESVVTKLHKVFSGKKVESRILRNWSIIITAHNIINKKIKLPVDPESFFKMAKKKIEAQNRNIKTSNEVARFWDVINYLIRNGELREGIDFKVEERASETLKIDKASVSWESETGCPQPLLYLNHARCFQKYLHEGVKSRTTSLRTTTLKFYLEKSPEFLGAKSAFRFKSGEHTDEGFEKTYVTTSFVFNYKMIHENYDIVLTSSVDGNEKETNNPKKDSEPPF